MFPTINKKETGVNLRRIMDMRGVKPKDIQEYLGFGCVQSVYRWLDGVSITSVCAHVILRTVSFRILLRACALAFSEKTVKQKTISLLESWMHM